MSTKVRAVEYFHVTVKARPGEAYRLLSQLAAADVNLLAFNAIPIGPEVTQLVLFPDSTDGLIGRPRADWTPARAPRPR